MSERSSVSSFFFFLIYKRVNEKKKYGILIWWKWLHLKSSIYESFDATILNVVFPNRVTLEISQLDKKCIKLFNLSSYFIFVGFITTVWRKMASWIANCISELPYVFQKKGLPESQIETEQKFSSKLKKKIGLLLSWVDKMDGGCEDD